MQALKNITPTKRWDLIQLKLSDLSPSDTYSACGRRVRARWTSILYGDCVAAQAIRWGDGKAACRQTARTPGEMIYAWQGEDAIIGNF